MTFNKDHFIPVDEPNTHLVTVRTPALVIKIDDVSKGEEMTTKIIENELLAERARKNLAELEAFLPKLEPLSTPWFLASAQIETIKFLLDPKLEEEFLRQRDGQKGTS